MIKKTNLRKVEKGGFLQLDKEHLQKHTHTQRKTKQKTKQKKNPTGSIISVVKDRMLPPYDSG